MIVWDWQIERAKANAEAAIDRGLRAMALDGAGLIQNAMRESPATGRAYRRGKTVVHQASAPGEPPKPDTGRLVGAVFATMPEKRGGDLLVSIVANTEYAAHLELGTEKMAARPYIVSTIGQHWDTRLMPIFSAVAAQ